MQHVNFHEKSWSIAVPKSNTLSKNAIVELENIANLYQKKDLIELLLRDWLGWRYQHKIEFASILSIPRDYHWITMLGKINSNFMMIDFLIADVNGFPLEEIEDMMKYVKSNYETFGYEHFTLAFISESFHHLNTIPEPIEINGVTVAYIPFILKRRSLELYEVGKGNQFIELFDYEWNDVDLQKVGAIERSIKWSGTPII